MREARTYPGCMLKDQAFEPCAVCAVRHYQLLEHGHDHVDSTHILPFVRIVNDSCVIGFIQAEQEPLPSLQVGNGRILNVSRRRCALRAGLMLDGGEAWSVG